MTLEERAQKIEAYGSAHQQLVDGIKQFPTEMWDFRPASDRWTIHEIIVHITDSEANSYVRARRFIAEPTETLMAYDEMAWAEKLNYAEQSADDALELFRWLRHNTYNLVKDLPAETWTHTAYHPENGTMTMDDWLNTYERHVPDHLQQMTEVYQDWQNRS